MVRKLKLVWLILFAGLLLGLFVYAIHFESRAKQPLSVLSEATYQNITTTRELIPADKAAGKLLNSGVEAAITFESYLICAPLDAEAALKAVSFEGNDFQAAFAPDAAFGSFANAVAQNHPFQLVIWNGKHYFEQQVFFTSLPVMTFAYDTPFACYSNAEAKISAIECTVITADGSVMQSAAMTSIRGQLASSFPKIPYRLKLYRNRGTRNPQPLLGMKASSEWVMLSMYTDPARIRDNVSLGLWNDLADTNPSVDGKTAEFEYCEVVVNNFYEGLYGIVRPVDEETLGIDDDTNARFYQFNYDFLDKDIERYHEEPIATLATRAELKYPKKYPSGTDVWSPLAKYSDLFCANLRKPTVEELQSLFNKSNAIDYSLFAACASGYDNLYKNMYMIWRQDETGEYRMFRVPWDLDFTWGDYYGGEFTALHMDFDLSKAEDDRITYDMQAWLALDSGEMKQAFLSRWKELRKTLFSEESLQARMTKQATYLQQNGVYQRDSARWQDSPASADLTKTFEFVHARLTFLDEYFAELTK